VIYIKAPFILSLFAQSLHSFRFHWPQHFNTVCCLNLVQVFRNDGFVLHWFKSYVSSRCFDVICDKNLFSCHTCSRGDRQGSVFGCLLSIMYTALFSILNETSSSCWRYNYFSFYQADLDLRIIHLQNVNESYPLFRGNPAWYKSVSSVYPDKLQTRLFTKSAYLFTQTLVARRRQNPTVVAQKVTFAGALNVAARRAVGVACCTDRQHNVYHHAVKEYISYIRGTPSIKAKANKKLRYREEHSASVVLSWCALWHLLGKICWWLANHFYVIGNESYRIRRITQNNGHYAVQGHSRSPILVPIESLYATSFQWLIETYLLSCAVTKLWPIIGRIFAIDTGVPDFNAPAGGDPLWISG